MGGGKSTYSRAADTGQDAANTASMIAKELYTSTGPLRASFMDEFKGLSEGEMPFGSNAWNSMFSAARGPIEDQYGRARENILATNPTGGGMFENLANIETEKAGTLGGISAQYLSDFLNKAYGAAWQTPQTSMAGLGSVMNFGTGAMQAAEQGSQARASMCCFVFAATDPKDELLEYVRRYKDSHYDVDSTVAHGYKRLALWLVPSMRKYKTIKKLIKFIMVHPMEMYAKAHYEERVLLKMVLSPIAHFWTFIYSVVGNCYGLKEWIQYWRLTDKW